MMHKKEVISKHEAKAACMAWVGRTMGDHGSRHNGGSWVGGCRHEHICIWWVSMGWGHMVAWAWGDTSLKLYAWVR